MTQPNCSQGTTRGKKIADKETSELCNKRSCFYCSVLPNLKIQGQNVHLGKIQPCLSWNSWMELPLCQIWQQLQEGNLLPKHLGADKSKALLPAEWQFSPVRCQRDCESRASSESAQGDVKLKGTRGKAVREQTGKKSRRREGWKGDAEVERRKHLETKESV